MSIWLPGNVLKDAGWKANYAGPDQIAVSSGSALFAQSEYLG